MRKYVFSILFALPLLGIGQNVKGIFDYKLFCVPDKGNMIEMYFNFDGTSVDYLPTSDGYSQAQVETTLIIRQHSDIIDFKKDVVKSPEVLGDKKLDFYHQQRFLIPNGDYVLEINLKDLNKSDGEVLVHEEPIKIRSPKKEVFISDIELVAGFTDAEANSEWAKSGLDVIPFLSSHYGSEFNELVFYAEIYNATKTMGENGKFLLSYYIENIDTEEVVKDIITRKRKNAEQVSLVFTKLNISELPTGMYNLVVEVKDTENETIAIKKKPITRHNSQVEEYLNTEEINETFVGKYNHRDSLLEHIYALRPIASYLEQSIIDNSLESLPLINLKTFYYNFWLERNLEAPQLEAKKYQQSILEVDQLFGTRLLEGYQTDRGRVYLRYGPPNTITDKTRDEDAYPYYIWHYYRAGQYNNGKFVFYNREIGNEDFELLHSNVRGERKNEKWNLILHSRNTPDVLFYRGISRAPSVSGVEAEEFYTNPW